MALYTFYLCYPDGDAGSFMTFDLHSEGEAPALALKMLRDHPACAYVQAWQGARLVLTQHALAR